MNRNIFKDYIDAYELEKEMDERIQRLEEECIAHDVVSGSNPDHPYQSQHFHTEGMIKQTNLNAEWDNLKRQQEKVRQIRQQVEEIMKQAPARIQRIIQYKYFENMTWYQVADKIGRGATKDSIKKEFQRFLKNI